MDVSHSSPSLLAVNSPAGERDIVPLYALGSTGNLGLVWTCILCFVVAISYTASASISTHVQVACEYDAAYMITYLNEAFLGILAVVAVACGRSHLGDIRALVRKQLPWALLLAPLALGANVAFTLALRLTSVASAVTLEQLTSLFIAGLSYCILKARYRLLSLPFLLVAVAGAILATLGDAKGNMSSGQSPLLGDLVSLVVAFMAALYMVLFKHAFPSMQAPELVLFLSLKAAVTVFGGWVFIILFDALGWERARLPTGCARTWYPIGAVVGALFNCSLIWATIKISPLTARLSLLFAIPCSFAIGLFTTGIFKPSTFCGVLLIFIGVFGFESLSKQPNPPNNGNNRAEAAVADLESTYHSNGV